MVHEFEEKMKKLRTHPAFKNKKIEKGIIYLGEIDPAIIKIKYFQHIINFEQLLKT